MTKVGLVLVAALLLVGCSAKKQQPLSKSGYERTLKATIGSLNTKLTQLSFAAGIAPEVAAARIEQIQKDFRAAAGRLDKVGPPANVQSAHDQLIDGLREFADALDQGREAAKQGKPEELREFQEGLGRAPSTRKLRRALGRLQDAGYSPGF